MSLGTGVYYDREAFAKVFEESGIEEWSKSLFTKKNDVTPKLRMVAKTRIESVTSNEVKEGSEEWNWAGKKNADGRLRIWLWD